MLDAFSSYPKALIFLFQKKLAWFFIFPLIITVLVFVGGLSITSYATDLLSELIKGMLSGWEWLPDWASFLEDVLYWLLWLILRIILYFFLAFVGGSIILLMMAPVLTWLSERVAANMGAEVPDFSLPQFMRDLTRAAGLAMRNGAFQLVLSLACFVLGFVPVIGFVAPFLLFALNAYFYGFNFMDYTLERRKYSVKESGAFVWKNKFKSMSIGTPFALWMLIPFIGPISSGFIAVLATVAATLNLESKQLSPSVYEE